jgi:hypothetical protein
MQHTQVLRKLLGHRKSDVSQKVENKKVLRMYFPISLSSCLESTHHATETYKHQKMLDIM